MSSGKVAGAAIWALGATQIIGYGTLYYSYSMLAPAVAEELAWSRQWVLAVFSVALFASALMAPVAGHLADRFGAGKMMMPGSAAAAAALLLCALAPGRWSFTAGVLAMELASCFVLYSTAFVALVQLGGGNAQRSITHLTLIAGFASTLFWPLTAMLHEHLSWREIFAVFAALHLAVCLPVHAWLARRSRYVDENLDNSKQPAENKDPASRQRRGASPLFLLMLAAFAIEGFVLSAVLVQMVPLLAAVGLGASSVFVATLFGPSQVASRLINMLFGNALRQTWLALGATGALCAGLAVLLLTAPSLSGAVLFAILFGLGSGLMSIVGGTLPLEVFGRDGYGARVGWITAARQFSSAFAPFGFALMMAGLGVFPALWINALIGLAGIGAFAGIAIMQVRAHKSALAREIEIRLGMEITS
ncbi:MFS transporter [Phyllobacterium phragmitis]|uniref:MFS transporter n=1 Tax=Phyllobacterium phragmitis TaxID=2670329 RepID=A0A2S9IWL3_9HYPH|nr:arsenite efflux MFS transporter ArsK [Phyllobacterium phragmitis]PRD44914.1 MFS transporter [Phyllobacterium phragmitis]